MAYKQFTVYCLGFAGIPCLGYTYVFPDAGNLLPVMNECWY